jgi:Gylcosyl hydrolase family 115 C-terminal domain/TNFR/NGFR cysteine-rich region
MAVLRNALSFFALTVGTSGIACTPSLDDYTAVPEPVPSATATPTACLDCDASVVNDAATPIPDGGPQPGDGASPLPDGGGPPVTICLAGTFVAVDAEGDAVGCESCPLDTYSLINNATACEPMTDCMPGEYVATAGSARNDRECEPCPDGTDSTEVNAGMCTFPGDCEAGYVDVSEDGDGSDCEKCAAGTFCAGGSNPAVECESGYVDGDRNPASLCTLKTECPTGKYVADEGTTSIDRTCADCDSGEFSDTPNAAACKLWRNCDEGSYVSVQGSPSVNRVCTQCSNGTFSETPNAAVCTPWSASCRAPNQYVASASATADRICATCAAGEITLQDNETSCATHAFQMVSGTAAFEAENYFYATSQGVSDAWKRLTVAGISGDACMEIGPDDGSDWTGDPLSTAPRLEYRVNFTQTGTFYVFVRGDAGPANGGASDSCWVGIDGAAASQYNFNSQANVWAWASGQPFTVNTTGVHLVKLYAREDGFRADKIVVSTNASSPGGSGPPESPMQ